ncbi:MAG: pseudouridine synthase [Saprospiraceae bacterium]|nr:pseudouridine synthase [Saprospiraceae bacterium]
MSYYFVYKPFGMLSQFTQEQAGQSTLADLHYTFPKDAYPVGRLDADSEGLLLISSDKTLNAKLLHPKHHAQKTYYVQVEGKPTALEIAPLQTGVVINVKGKPYRTAPAKVQLLETMPQLPPREPPIRFRKSIPDSWLSIILIEGKNRQVRKMCAALGFPVLRLVRVALEGYNLYQSPLLDMQSGEVRHFKQLTLKS